MRQKLLIILALFLITFAGYELFYPKGGEKDLSDGFVRIDQINNNVKHKRSNNLSWEESYEGVNLNINDMIFTGDNSSTTLVTKENIRIFVAAGTLLVIRKLDGKLDLNLKQGMVDIVMAKPSNLVAGGRKIQSSNIDSVIRLEKGKVKVIKGEIKVNGNKLKQEKKITLLSPISSKQIILGEHDKIEFKWKNSIKLDTYKLVIQRLDKKVDKVVEETNKLKIKKFLDSGHYSWYVEGKQQEKVFLSEKNYFNVKVIYSKIRLVDFKPGTGAFVKFSYDRPLNINFSWKHVLIQNGRRKNINTDNYTYLFKLYSKKEKKGILIGEKELKAHNVNYIISKPGNYIWTVEVKGAGAEKYKISRMTIQVDRERAPAPAIEEKLEINLIEGAVKKDDQKTEEDKIEKKN